ncbi:MAG TPA: hypothetical protein VK741_09400 [Acetobacteraceae bacterium]|jgi:hypothetical protein|nr:hypothetical protein [Acetobacteraceae bacterium]
MAIWRKNEIAITFLDGLVEHPVVTVTIASPAGELRAMATPSQVGRSLILAGLHMHGELTSANQVGPANLIVLAQAVMEMMDVDELVVTAGLRTTGANPGPRQNRIRFTRRLAD